jgi:hypothetical protein
MLAQGVALGLGVNPLLRALKGVRESSAPSGRMTIHGYNTRGDAAGWQSPRHRRENVAFFARGKMSRNDL